jgi:hypothetical protein
MDSDGLNKWLTLAANIGVIAGIVFLALELRQNTEMMRAQTRSVMSQDTISMLTLDVSDATYLDTVNRGLAGEELTELEQAQFRRTYNAWIWHWNNLVYQHRVGLYDDSEYALQIEIVRRDIEQLPGLRKHWCDNSPRNASRDLIEAIEGGLDSDFCDS